MSKQKDKNDAACGGSALTAELESIAWATFSERSHAAQRRELEIFPGLRAEWEQWKEAWQLGFEAGRVHGRGDTVMSNELRL